ncbi:MAG: transporter substrate-binding protein [Frankiales bacterium]|nr:transporter substrate-binding protein [Frankiales bacterium]
MTRLRRPRVGHIDFLNCLPLYDGLVRSGALLDVRLRRETPDVLNGLLLAGELDIGPISLVPALQHHRELVVLPDIAVGSDGPVLSVVLVSKRPVAELDGSHISLGSTSRTSVLLAQMLLAQRYDVKASFETAAPDLGMMLRSADAAVLIGDPALRATYEAPAHGLHVLDLGAAWREWTSLPMVFAVWAARRSYFEEHAAQVAAVQRSFRASLTDSLARVDEVAERAAQWEPFDAATLAGYFRALDFRLGPRQLEGVAEFTRRGALLGAVPADAVLHLSSEA